MIVTMRRQTFGAILFVSLSIPGHGSLLTYNSRALFNEAAPGLPLETFETGLVPAHGLTTCTGPLSSASASGCFPAGALLPGVIYSALPGPSMVLLGPGFIFLP